MVVWIFSDKSKVEKGGEVGRTIRGSGEVHFGNVEIGDEEFRLARMVKHVKCSTDNGSEKSKPEQSENGPEATAAADITVGTMATVVIRSRPIKLAVWIIKLGFYRA